MESTPPTHPDSWYLDSDAYTDAISHDAWTPKFGAEIGVRHHALAYLSATRGFKSGGFNLTSTEPGRGFAPEWAWSYEAGLKTTLGGGRARLNAAGFHTDYTNLQVQTGIRPGVVDISNAATATIRGVELELETRLNAATRVGGHLAWLDSRYDRYMAIGILGTTPTTGSVAGNRLNNSPEWSGRFWVDWTRTLGPGGCCRSAPTLRGGRRCSSRRSMTASNARARWDSSTRAQSSDRHTNAGRSACLRAM